MDIQQFANALMKEDNNQSLRVNNPQVNTNNPADIAKFANDLISGKDNEKTNTSDLNSENSPPPDNLLHQVGRVVDHSLYGGVVRPVLGIANLGTELANGAWHELGGKSNLNYYTNEALNKSDELDRSLDDGRNDWASAGGAASTIGSLASILIPVGSEFKLAEKAGDFGKYLLDRDTYNTEQSIKNSLNEIKKVIPTKTENGLVVNKELNDELDNLNKLHQQHADLESANANPDQVTNVLNKIEQSKNNIQSLTDRASKIADTKEKVNNVVEEQLKNIEKQKSALSPNLASTLIDYGITGKKGYGIIPAATLGAINGAGESSNKDYLTQISNAIDGAALGGVSTGLLHYLANGGTNFIRSFKMPQHNTNITLSSAQERNIANMKDTQPSYSETKIANKTRELGKNLDPRMEYLLHMQEYYKLPAPQALQFGKNNQENLANYQNAVLKKIVKNYNVQNNNLPDRLQEAKNNVQLTPEKLDSPDHLWKREVALSAGNITDPPDYSYSNQFHSFMPNLMRTMQYPNLSTHLQALDFLNKDLERAYDKAIAADYKIPFADQSNAFLDYIDKNLSSVKAKNAELQPLIDLGIKSTQAYRTLDKAVDELKGINLHEETLPTSEKFAQYIDNKDLPPAVKSRILEELNKTGDTQTAINNLRKNHALYETSTPQMLEDKIRAHQDELNTETSKKFNGGDISVYNMRQYKDKIKDLGEDQTNSETRDIYHELAKHILPTFNQHQDEIYKNYLKTKDTTGDALSAFSNKAKNPKPYSVTKILRMLNDNVESAQAVHQLMKDSGYGDVNDVAKLTKEEINGKASLVDQGVDAFMNRLKELNEQKNRNAQALIKGYDDNPESLRDNFKKLTDYSSKKVGTQNSNNITISDEARAGILGSAPYIQEYEEQQKEADRRIKAELDYIANQSLFGSLNRSRNPLAGFKHGMVHGFKHRLLHQE